MDKDDFLLTQIDAIAIYQFISYSNVDWGGIMCASVVITLPIIIISFFLQRYIITGLTAGAVKG